MISVGIFLFNIFCYTTAAGFADNPGRWADNLETVLQNQVYDSFRMVNDRYGHQNRMGVVAESRINEMEIQLINELNETNTKNLERQKVINRFFLVVLLLLNIFLFFLFLKISSLSKAKAQIEAQNEEKERANVRLMELNAMRDKMFAVISHDLRNPFSAIVSFTRIIKRDVDQMSREELRSLINDLDKSVITINDLLDNMLQWSMAQSGSLTYRPEYIELSEMVQDNMSVYQQQADEKGLSFKSIVQPGIIVWADPNLTSGILRNLFSNAIKFTPAGGQIKVSAETAGKDVQVCVADTGVGVDADKQAKLFSATDYLTTRGTDDEKGSGLGLLICKEFSQRQGGRIWLVSEKHKGSSFYFSLPLQE